MCKVYYNKDEMNKKVLMGKIRMIESGIIPAINGHELKTMLESLDSNERNIAKRKFRKIWRRIAKKDKNLKELMISPGSSHPTKHTKRNRSAIVCNEFLNFNKLK